MIGIKRNLGNMAYRLKLRKAILELDKERLDILNEEVQKERDRRNKKR